MDKATILEITHCSPRELERWAYQGLIKGPEGYQGRQRVWPDDTSERVRIIQQCREDRWNAVDIAFELFLRKYPPQPRMLRKSLVRYLDRQLHLLYPHRPTIPDHPTPHDRRTIISMPERYDLPVTAKLADFMTEGVCYLAGMPTKYSYDDRPVIKRNYRSSSRYLPSPFKQRKLIEKASDHALRRAVSDATYQLEQQHTILHQKCYAIGLDPERAATIFLPGHACKAPHDITEALRPLMTVYALYIGEHRETLDRDFFSTAVGWYMEEFNTVFPALPKFFESSQFRAALKEFPTLR